jgi:hypothetical protein
MERPHTPFLQSAKELCSLAMAEAQYISRTRSNTNQWICRAGNVARYVSGVVAVNSVHVIYCVMLSLRTFIPLNTLHLYVKA